MDPNIGADQANQRAKGRGAIGFLLAFLGTGRGLEDSTRLYFILGAITLVLAAVFGSALIIGAFLMVLRRL